jgi:signal transduction histidine kinase
VSILIAAGYFAIAVGALWLTPGGFRDAARVSDILMFVIGMVFAVSMAAVAAEAEAARRRLAVYADSVGELAAATERNRLARDIHDSLGHHLTAISVQLEKATAFRHRDEAASEQALTDARRSARSALAEVRQSVGTLRAGGPAFALAPAMAALVEGVRDRDLAVELDVAGDEGRYPGPALLALYRAAQEGLTNVRRHAGATRIDMTVRLDETCASLVVADNGRGFAADQDEAGFGLRGMRERLEALDGSLRIEAAPGLGTRLLVTIPRPART